MHTWSTERTRCRGTKKWNSNPGSSKPSPKTYSDARRPWSRGRRSRRRTVASVCARNWSAWSGRRTKQIARLRRRSANASNSTSSTRTRIGSSTPWRCDGVRGGASIRPCLRCSSIHVGLSRRSLSGRKNLRRYWSSIRPRLQYNTIQIFLIFKSKNKALL